MPSGQELHPLATRETGQPVQLGLKPGLILIGSGAALVIADTVRFLAIGVSGVGYPAAPKVETMALLVSKYTCQ